MSDILDYYDEFKVCQLAKVTIDGDQFMWCLPYQNHLVSIISDIKRNPASFRNWQKHWIVDRKVLFTTYDSAFNPAMLGYGSILNGDVPMKENGSGLIPGVTFRRYRLHGCQILPVLLPLDKNGKYDPFALEGMDDGMMTTGGTLYVNEVPSSSILLDQPTTISDTVDSLALNWFKFGRVLVGGFTLHYSGTFDQFHRQLLNAVNIDT